MYYWEELINKHEFVCSMFIMNTRACLYLFAEQNVFSFGMDFAVDIRKSFVPGYSKLPNKRDVPNKRDGTK